MTKWRNKISENDDKGTAQPQRQKQQELRDTKLTKIKKETRNNDRDTK